MGFREELRRPFLPKGKKGIPKAKGFGAQFGRSIAVAGSGIQDIRLRATIKNVPGAPDLHKLRKKKIKPIKDYTPNAAYEPGIVIFNGV